MLFIVVVTCLLSCGKGMGQSTPSDRTLNPVAKRTDMKSTAAQQPVNEYGDMCLSANYCPETTSETLTTVLPTNSTEISSTVTTNAMTSSMDDNVTICCYEQTGQMCTRSSFIDCISCNDSCKHGCNQSDPDQCMCVREKVTNCTDYDENECKCEQMLINKDKSFLDKHLIPVIFIVVGGCLIIMIIILCLVRRCCFNHGGPITALSWKDMKKPDPVAKPTDMETTAAEQSTDDYGGVYGNIDETGQIKTESAPIDVAVTTHHGNRNDYTPDSTWLLPQQHQPDHGDVYENFNFHNQGRNNASFENEATSLPLLEITSKKKSKDTYLPKQQSIPETSPPPPPSNKPKPDLGTMLMKQLANLPAPRQIDDEDIHGTVTPMSSPKHTEDYGGMYETPNVQQLDFGGDYEVPAQAANQHLGDSKDFGDDYEVVIKDNNSSARVPDQDFGDTYEPVSASNKPDTHTKKRKAQKLPPPVPDSDYGGEYGNVNVDRNVNVVKKLSEKFDPNSLTQKMCPPLPVQKKKPQVSKKPQGRPAKKLENKLQDYGDTYEAPMPQGIASQPDYGGDYEAPMVQNIAKEKDFGGDYEAPMVQNTAREQDFGEDYEAPMIQNTAREQDFGGDYEAPMSQQKPDDPDFGSIYENTMVGSLQKPTAREAIDPPVEDYNQVYDQPYAYDQPLKLKGMRGDYYNQPAPKAGPAINKENYTKLYRT